MHRLFFLGLVGILYVILATIDLLKYIISLNFEVKISLTSSNQIIKRLDSKIKNLKDWIDDSK